MTDQPDSGQMKWWGWGDRDTQYDIAGKPKLWQWLNVTLGLNRALPGQHLPLCLPTPAPSRMPPLLVQELYALVPSNQIATNDLDRVIHSYGKSYRDLLRLRMGILTRSPDLIFYPESVGQVEELVRWADSRSVALIPFGGGTNIVGGVETTLADPRPTICVDLKRMCQVKSVDPYSKTARIECGISGPHLERILRAKGLCLGHEPDSFEFSTLGGWIATRSAGMQSNAYGKIEDMVLGLTVATPRGNLVTLPTPASSAGPDLTRVVCGSEGTLGIITEATMQLHPVPDQSEFFGFIFPNFELGVEAVRRCAAAGCLPATVRLLDEAETDLAFHMKPRTDAVRHFAEMPFKWFLKQRGYRHPCIMIVGIEGQKSLAEAQKRFAFRQFAESRGVNLGQSPGKRWHARRFELPYLRDLVMDHGVMVDVAETATVWSNILPLYAKVRRVLLDSVAADGVRPYVGCHLSHFYPSGACLYFTFAGLQIPGQEVEQYNRIKSRVTETIVHNGGTLSHHHGVGYEHQPWLGAELSPLGLRALRALKADLDPANICNPGKSFAPISGQAVIENFIGVGGK